MRSTRKAGRAVRLFLCCTLAPCLLPAEDDSIPIRWKREAVARVNQGNGVPLIPDYERSLVEKIHKRIIERKDADLEDYESTVPANNAKYEMVFLEGGSFLMGSPDNEVNRNLDEGPQRKIKVSGFWIGKYEVSWGQFRAFALRTNKSLYLKSGSPRNPAEMKKLVDWVSTPTVPYVTPDFGMGLDDDFPVIGITHNAANRFCQWLSLQTGHFYRLPTEAEWEYACRAGTSGPYHCDIDELNGYAVVDPDTSNWAYARVGSKKPNPWGIFDMHGNVAEWCLDAYRPGYSHLHGTDPWLPPKQRYGRVIRGGSWSDTPEYCRSAARFCSHPDLNLQDPQQPKSIWWLVDATWLGFRIVRPVEIPDKEEMYEIWNSGAMHHHKEDGLFELR